MTWFISHSLCNSLCCLGASPINNSQPMNPRRPPTHHRRRMVSACGDGARVQSFANNPIKFLSPGQRATRKTHKLSLPREWIFIGSQKDPIPPPGERIPPPNRRKWNLHEKYRILRRFLSSSTSFLVVNSGRISYFHFFYLRLVRSFAAVSSLITRTTAKHANSPGRDLNTYEFEFQAQDWSVVCSLPVLVRGSSLDIGRLTCSIQFYWRCCSDRDPQRNLIISQELELSEVTLALLFPRSLVAQVN